MQPELCIALPSEAAVTASSGEGDVKVADMGKAVSAHSDQGDVTIAGGSGTVQASSGQGTVTVSRSYASSVSVQSGQGDATVDLLSSPNRVSASSGQGDVTVELPKGPNSYQVNASSGEGSVSTAWATTRRVIGSSTHPRDKETSPSVTARGDLSSPQSKARRRESRRPVHAF